jgi:hypothetical protein
VPLATTSNGNPPKSTRAASFFGCFPGPVETAFCPAFRSPDCRTGKGGWHWGAPGQRAATSDQEHDLTGVPDTRKAFWHFQLGEALAGLNRLDGAVGHSRIALQLLRQRLPERKVDWAARLVWEALKQLMWGEHLLLDTQV